MLAAVHVARWLPVRREGGPVGAIAFVANRCHPRLTPGASRRSASSPPWRPPRAPLGRCADYLMNTVAHLRRLGIREPRLATL